MPNAHDSLPRFTAQPGTLYLCPTPLGNLGDITLRTLEVLKQADIIAAEDTRRSVKLLNHFEIKKPLTSYHAHNRSTKKTTILNHLRHGKIVAQISDAGMPGISDPGADLIKACLEESLPFEVLPGPSAALLGVVGSGLPTERFVFEGFLARDKKERGERLELIRRDDRTLIFYEAPHRIKATLKALIEAFGDRPASLGRELTKLHETWIRSSLAGILDTLQKQEHALRGEMVLVVAGMDTDARMAEDKAVFEHLTVEAQVAQMMENGVDKKSAVRETARLRGMPKREVYSLTLDL